MLVPDTVQKSSPKYSRHLNTKQRSASLAMQREVNMVEKEKHLQKSSNVGALKNS
jgi:hypothetical protein